MVQRTHTPGSLRHIFMVYYPTYSNFDGLQKLLILIMWTQRDERYSGALRRRKLGGSERWTCRSLILAA